MKRFLCTIAIVACLPVTAQAEESGGISAPAAASAGATIPAVPVPGAPAMAPAASPLVGRSGDSYRYSNMFPSNEALDRLDIDNVEVKATDDGKLTIARGGRFSGGSGVSLLRYDQLHRMRTTPEIRDVDLRTEFSFEKAGSGKDSLFGLLFAFYHGQKFDMLPNETGTYLVIELTAEGKLRTRLDRYVPADAKVSDYYVAARAAFRDLDLSAMPFEESIAEGFRADGAPNTLHVVRKDRQWQVFVNEKLAKTFDVDNLSPIPLNDFPAYLVGGKTVVKIHSDAIDASYLNSRLREEIAKYPPTLGTMTGVCAKPGITVLYGGGQEYGTPGILLGAPGFTNPDGGPLFFGYRILDNGAVRANESPSGTRPVLFGNKLFDLRGTPSIHLDNMSLGFRIIGDSRTVSRTKYQQTYSTEYCDLMVFRKPAPPRP